VLRDLAGALFTPQRFFAGLVRRTARPGRAFLALLLPIALGTSLQLLGLDALIAQLPAALAGSVEQIGKAAFAVGLLASAPLGALGIWLLGWLPLRVAVGRRARLGELAAWAQLPSALVSLLSTAAAAFAALPPAVGLAATLAGELWCVWLVYEALGVFAPDARWRGVAAYVLFALLLLALGLYEGSPGAPPGLVF
jgi:hypothetical protein